MYILVFLVVFSMTRYILYDIDNKEDGDYEINYFNNNYNFKVKGGLR